MTDETLIRCCAPTMACLKTGNMFSHAFEHRAQMTAELRRINRCLSRKGMRIIPLRWRDGKALLYLYRPAMLSRDLLEPLSRKLLTECGYSCHRPNACLMRLMTRMRTEDAFPHEVGLFLGYPPEDVDGFMHRRGDCKWSGLWKVYGDVEEAIQRCARYRRCTAAFLSGLSRGYSLEHLAVTAHVSDCPAL